MVGIRSYIKVFFPIAQAILESKWAKSTDSVSFVALAFQNNLEYRHSDF